MNPNLKWKALFILAVILLCVYGLVGLPTFPTSLAMVKENFSKQIKLGLDLQGGTHLVLQVQVHEAIAQETDQMVDRLTKQLRDKNIRYDEIRRVDDTHILVRNVESTQVAAFRDLIQQQYGNLWDASLAAGEQSGYTLTLRPSYIAQLQETTMTQSLETIERRINALGLTEPTIQRRGRNENEILVQLPGEGDPSRAKAVIQAGGQLELRLVEDPRTYGSQTEALGEHGGILPPGTELLPEDPRGRAAANSSPTGEVWYLASRAPVVTGRDLKGASESRNTNNPTQWQVQFTLSAEAARRFGPFTDTNKGRQLAIVLEHKVYSAPVINGRIDDQGVIEGNFGQESAHDLALVLRAGALPAPLTIVDERTISGTLGSDSIHDGVRAGIVGVLLVIVIMIGYYRMSGALAVAALTLYCLFTVAGLAMFGFTLTLPGLAGFVLSIGIAVDANVLIFERIREELVHGKSLRIAVEDGFLHAMNAIVDSNVSTALTALILYAVGTGPVQGFAITLIIGIAASMISAIFVVKTLFLIWLNRRPDMVTLSI
jgi:preprotein translocase subunit SecD